MGPDYDLNTGRATTSGRRRVGARSRLSQGKWGSIHAQRPPDYDEISEHQIINARSMARIASSSCMGRAAAYYALDRNGAFVAGKQYVDKLTWTKGVGKTSLPSGDPTKDVQPYGGQSSSGPTPWVSVPVAGQQELGAWGL
jgi:hypothetical protein